MGLMKSLNVAKTMGKGPAIGFRVGVSFDDRAVLRAVDRATRGVLIRQGAFTRKTIQRSIRRRKKHSPAGDNPPNTQTGFLRRSIVFGYDRARQSVIVGPHMGQRVADLHEFGGAVQMEVARTPSGKTALFRVGGKRPRWARKTVGRKTARYPSRSYTRRGLDTVRPKLDDFWKDAVRR